MSLTPHQVIILALAANGRTDTEIGTVLGVGPGTIARHLGVVYRVLGARNRTHAVALALVAGELTSADIESP